MLSWNCQTGTIQNHIQLIYSYEGKAKQVIVHHNPSDAMLTGERSYYISHTSCRRKLCDHIGKNPPPKESMIFHYPNSPPVLNQYLYRGRETFDNKFRLMVAGGGTGSTTLFMGEELQHTNSQVINN